MMTVVDTAGNVVAAFKSAGGSSDATRVGYSAAGYAVGHVVAGGRRAGEVVSTELSTGVRTMLAVTPALLGAYDAVELGAHVLVSDSRRNKVARITPSITALSNLTVGLNPCQMVAGVNGGLSRVFVANEGGRSYTVVW
jgi:hypothetical protein